MLLQNITILNISLNYIQNRNRTATFPQPSRNLPATPPNDFKTKMWLSMKYHCFISFRTQMRFSTKYHLFQRSPTTYETKRYFGVWHVENIRPALSISVITAAWIAYFHSFARQYQLPIWFLDPKNLVGKFHLKHQFKPWFWRICRLYSKCLWACKPTVLVLAARPSRANILSVATQSSSVRREPAP